RDPTLLVSDMITADPAVWCSELRDVLAGGDDESGQSAWLELWRGMNESTQQVLSEMASEDLETMFEGRVVTELQEMLPPGSVLFIGNSMPIRDVDTFFKQQEHPITLMGNRGANGIDGLISTAIGFSAAG